MTWIKWWKSKFFLRILVIIIAGMALSFIPAYFLTWGWIPAIIIALSTGFILRKLVINKLDQISNEIS